MEINRTRRAEENGIATTGENMESFSFNFGWPFCTRLISHLLSFKLFRIDTIVWKVFMMIRKSLLQSHVPKHEQKKGHHLNGLVNWFFFSFAICLQCTTTQTRQSFGFGMSWCSYAFLYNLLKNQMLISLTFLGEYILLIMLIILYYLEWNSDSNQKTHSTFQ